MLGEPQYFTKSDLRNAFREGWKRRDETIRLRHNSAESHKRSSVINIRYHHSIFIGWFNRTWKNERP